MSLRFSCVADSAPTLRRDCAKLHVYGGAELAARQLLAEQRAKAAKLEQLRELGDTPLLAAVAKSIERHQEQTIGLLGRIRQMEYKTLRPHAIKWMQQNARHKRCHTRRRAPVGRSRPAATRRCSSRSSSRNDDPHEPPAHPSRGGR